MFSTLCKIPQGRLRVEWEGSWELNGKKPILIPLALLRNLSIYLPIYLPSTDLYLYLSLYMYGFPWCFLPFFFFKFLSLEGEFRGVTEIVSFIPYAVPVTTITPTVCHCSMTCWINEWMVYWGDTKKKKHTFSTFCYCNTIPIELTAAFYIALATYQSLFHVLNILRYLILTTNLRGRCYYYPYCLDD